MTPRAAIPIRLASGLGSQAEAEAFVGAARNGADVISCSWGPPDGAWWDPNDPAHRQVGLLPDSTRLALPFASTQGRSGKGCVVLFVTGNGNESVDNARVIAVAACNDLLKRSAYSEFGKAVWSSVPSSDGRPSLTPGIWTTSRYGGLDHNQGSPRKGDPAGHHTNSSGGTSIRDLVVRLLPPAALAGLKGKDPSGTWTLEVPDTARADRGTLRSLQQEMGF